MKEEILYPIIFPLSIGSVINIILLDLLIAKKDALEGPFIKPFCGDMSYMFFEGI